MAAYVSTFLALSATILNTIVIITTNNGVHVTESLNWGWARSANSSNGFNKIYVGVWNVVLRGSSGSADQVVSFTSNSCESMFTEDVCDDCSDGMRACITFASIALALCAIGLFTSFQRQSSTGNTVTNKLVGAITSLLAVFSAVISGISFARGCFKPFYDQVNQYTGYWYYGPAFILLIVALLIKIVDFIVHLATPTGDAAAPPAQKHEAVPPTAV